MRTALNQPEIPCSGKTFKLTIEDYEKIYSECSKERIKN